MRPYGRGVTLLTPSDTNELVNIKQLIVLSDGNITVTDSNGVTTLIEAFKGLVLPVSIKFLKSTGTTGGIKVLGIMY